MVSDEAMMVFLQCRPDKRVKINLAEVLDEHKEEDKMNIDDETSSDDKEEEQDDKESMMAFEKQTSSSDSETSENSEMISESSFWISDMGPNTPSLNKNKTDDTYDSGKFIQKLNESEKEINGFKVRL